MKALRESNRAGMSFKHPQVLFGNRIYEDLKFATDHFCFTGSAGTGKTTFIKLLMLTALCGMGPKRDCRAFVYDYKCELYPFLFALIRHLCPETPLDLFNPFDARSVWWDIGADFTKEEDARQLAAILVPAEPGERDVYFRDATRNIVASLVVSLNRRNRGEWRFRHLINALSEKEAYERILGRDPDTALAAKRTGSDQTQANVDATVSNTYHKFKVIADHMGAAEERGNEGLSVQKWVRDHGVLLVTVKQTAEDVLEPLYRALLYALRQHVLDQPNPNPPDSRRTWIFLDEFPTLKPVPGFERFLTNGRSKGACVVLGFQNIETLQGEEHYGALASTLYGECKSRLFFRASTYAHAEWAAKEYGMREVYKESREVGRNWGISLSTGPGGGGGGGPISVTTYQTTRTVSENWSVNVRGDYEYDYLRYPGEFQNLPLVHETDSNPSQQYFAAFLAVGSDRAPIIVPQAVAVGPLQALEAIIEGHTEVDAFIPRGELPSTGELFTKQDWATLRIPLAIRENRVQAPRENVLDAINAIERPL